MAKSFSIINLFACLMGIVLACLLKVSTLGVGGINSNKSINHMSILDVVS